MLSTRAVRSLRLGCAVWVALALLSLTGSANAATGVETLEREFPGLANVAEPEGGRSGLEAHRDERVARVAGEPGKVIVSSRPLRAVDETGDLSPVDMRLRDRGATHEPDNAPFELSIGDEAHEGFRVGPTAAQEISVVPLDVSGSAGEASKLAGSLFYGETHPDTDTIVVPAAAGVETFEQLRSTVAPDRFSYRISLAPGQSMRMHDGALEVRQGATVIVRALPPAAVDSAGSVVPARMALDGDILTVEVDHRREGVQHPVLLDPNWVSTYDWAGNPDTGNEGFYIDQEPAAGAPWYEAFATGHPVVPGIWARPLGGRVYPPEAKARIFFLAPGSTKISRVSWRQVSHLNDGDRQLMLTGPRLSVHPQ